MLSAPLLESFVLRTFVHKPSLQFASSRLEVASYFGAVAWMPTTCTSGYETAAGLPLDGLLPPIRRLLAHHRVVTECPSHTTMRLRRLQPSSSSVLLVTSSHGTWVAFIMIVPDMPCGYKPESVAFYSDGTTQ